MDKSNKDIHMNTTKMYIDKDGTKKYRNSKGYLHRADGPAKEHPNGTNWWYKEGKYHRLDGPACEYSDGNKYWYILNQYLEEKEFNSWISRIQKCI